MKNNCYYFVEGKCEEKLINTLKEEPRRIAAGRVKVYNVITNELTKSQLITIQPGSTVVFVYDTDVLVTKHIKNNIALLKKYCKVNIVYLAQVKI